MNIKENCPTCGAPCDVTWLGLDFVETTGDETLASKEHTAEKKFPNGFTSWMETHHEVATFIERVLLSEPDYHDSDDTCIVWMEQHEGGTGRIYELGEEWTDEFENLNKGREWDGEFLDEIDAFLIKKNSQ